MLIYIIFLSLLEAFTEFLPISSTGHMILFSNIFNINIFDFHFLEIIIQSSAILAVIFYYHKDIKIIIIDIFSNNKNININHNRPRFFIIKLIISILPSIIFGLLFYDIIKNIFFLPVSIAIAFIIGGIIMLIIEKYDYKFMYKKHIKHIYNINYISALYIGLFQSLSLIAGVSRSASSIFGAKLIGYNNNIAIKYSFFLAIPTIFATTIFDIYKNYQYINFDNYIYIIFAFLLTFIFSLLVIKFFLFFVERYNFIYFAYYRIIIGSILLLILFL